MEKKRHYGRLKEPLHATLPAPLHFSVSVDLIEPRLIIARWTKSQHNEQKSKKNKKLQLYKTVFSFKSHT